MSEVDDARIEALAGVSLSAPRREYRAEGLSFGDATLSRDGSSERWQSLTLTLRGPDATPGSNVRSLRPSVVSFSLTPSRLEHYGEIYGMGAPRPGDLPFGTRALIVDHALLSNPAWLLDPASALEGASSDAANALEELRATLTRYLDDPMPCSECAAKAARARPARRPARGSMQAGYLEMLRRMGVNISFLEASEPEPEPEPNCPHAPMRAEALRALFARHPELAFECLGVLVPHTKGERPRFVLNPAQMPTLLRDWLSAPDHVTAERPSARFDASASSPGEVQRIWPESVPKPAPPAPSLPPPPREKKATEKKATEKKATEKKATEKKATEKKATEVSSEKAAEAPFTAGQMVMSSQVRDAGYDAAAVKRLLKAGTLERVDFGWYRWKG
ncbi:MAG: hypothetical protein R3A48_01085 [Polyangiales bacterium]